MAIGVLTCTNRESVQWWRNSSAMVTMNYFNNILILWFLSFQCIIKVINYKYSLPILSRGVNLEADSVHQNEFL